jgi:hemerythrin-like metal-binding protein
MSIEWTEELSVHVKLIDEQHKHFIGIINKLYKANENLTIKKDLPVLISELIEYAKVHFATEEKYFDLFNYEGGSEHKAQHHMMYLKLEEFKNNLSGDLIKLTEILMSFVEDWLVIHIEEYDKKYVECFTSHGLS